jgi:predicted DNA-binding protein
MTLSLPAWRVGRLAGFGRLGKGVAVERMSEVIPGYTSVVKTAISIPDETFARAEEHAEALGMSRSEFFTRAVRRYIDHLEAESLTGRINAAIDMAWPDGMTIDAVRYGLRHPATGDGSW